MTLQILSTVSVFFVLIVTILVFQIKSAINASKVEQEKLLKLVEDTSELNKQLTQIVSDNNKNQTESSQVLKKQVDNLTQTTEKLETHFDNLDKANTLSRESLTQAINSSKNIYQENLQALSQKLEVVSTISGKVDNLAEATEKLEAHLNELDKANTHTRESLTQALENTKNQQQENLQVLSEKLEAVDSISGKVDNLTEATAKFEAHLNGLDKANTQTRENLTQAIDSSKNIYLENLQVLSEKLEAVDSISGKVDNLAEATEKFEAHLNGLDKANTLSRESLTKTIEGNNNLSQKSLKALSEKLEAVSSISDKVENLTKTTEKLEKHLNQLDKANTHTRESLSKTIEGNNQTQNELQALSEKLESVSSVSSKVDNLTKTTEKIEKNIAQLDKADTQSQQNLNLGEIDAQLNNQQEQLKAVVEKLAGFETIKTQIDNVAKTVTKLETNSNKATQPKTSRSRPNKTASKKNTSTGS